MTDELQTIEGVAFTGALQRFFNEASIIKMSEKIVLTATEKELWEQLFSFKQLGNNLWGISL